MMPEGNSCIGKACGGKGTKVHALVSRECIPVALSLSAANREDFDEAIPLLEQVSCLKGANLLGDRAYGTRKLRAYYAQRGAEFTVPPSKNMKDQWEWDHETYKRRNVVERFFCRLKDFRRVCTRYDKRDDSFACFVLVAAIFVSFAILHI